MRLTTTRTITPLALLSLVAAGACSSGSAPDAAARDALQRDLALAQSASVSLASASALPRTRFVSALEAGERPTAGTSAAARPSRRSPTKAPRAHAEQAPPAVTAVAATDASQSVAAEPQRVPEPAATAAVATEAAQAPASAEAGGPSAGGPSGSDSGENGVPSMTPGSSDGGPVITRRGRGIGGIIGVVIRGGGTGDIDHCERDRPGARGGGLPFPVGRGMPGGMTMGGVPMSGVGRGTFPRM